MSTSNSRSSLTATVAGSSAPSPRSPPGCVRLCWTTGCPGSASRWYAASIFFESRAENGLNLAGGLGGVHLRPGLALGMSVAKYQRTLSGVASAGRSWHDSLCLAGTEWSRARAGRSMASTGPRPSARASVAERDRLAIARVLARWRPAAALAMLRDERPAPTSIHCRGVEPRLGCLRGCRGLRGLCPVRRGVCAVRAVCAVSGAWRRL
ncbi:uncharacterized protein V1510DRAFT_413620 [Dipodascopsis tothii]|uniref:uncharacterized protein n=1 Tax=Dipodascopsis tothii TaxID=44089 RepID=UPI0034CEB199